MNNEYHNQDFTIPAIADYTLTQRQAPPILENQYGSVPENFLENSLILNLGKTATFHMSFPDSLKERDMIFRGQIYEVARDHIVVGDSAANKWYMIPLLYLNYAEFDGPTEKFPVTYNKK